MLKVLIATPAESEWSGLPDDLDIRFCGASIQSIDSAIESDTEVLITELLPGALEKCEGLRWVQFVASGVDYIAGHPLLERDILMSSAAGICAVHIAEMIVARILYHIKEFRAFQELQKEHTWPNRVAMARPCLRDARAVIIGYGGVGRETARLLSAFGVKITAVEQEAARQPYKGYCPYEEIGDQDALLPERIVSHRQLHEVLPDADFIVLCLSLDPSSVHLIDAEALSLVKPSAILVNISRGQIIDMDALLVALDAGKLAHAYLDVFEKEPLAADSPLWNHPRVSITPHMAGVMPDVVTKVQNLFLVNLERYRKGQTLINQIDRRLLQRD